MDSANHFCDFADFSPGSRYAPSFKATPAIVSAAKTVIFTPTQLKQRFFLLAAGKHPAKPPPKLLRP